MFVRVNSTVAASALPPSAIISSTFSLMISRSTISARKPDRRAWIKPRGQFKPELGRLYIALATIESWFFPAGVSVARPAGNATCCKSRLAIPSAPATEANIENGDSTTFRVILSGARQNSAPKLNFGSLSEPDTGSVISFLRLRFLSSATASTIGKSFALALATFSPRLSRLINR